MTRVLRTWPSGVMMTSILTRPETFMRRANSGYAGEVFVLILRLPSSVEASCAKACEAKTATAAADSANRVQRDLIAKASSCQKLPRAGKGTLAASAVHECWREGAG